MSCQTVQKLISPYLDDALRAREREAVSQHLADCRECASYSGELLRLSRVLRELPMAKPPARLTSQLRVMASHERARRLITRNLSALLHYWGDRLRLLTDNLMRPIALPFAGGVLSALFLFSMLVPTLGFRHNFRNDVPTALYTQASLEEASPFWLTGDETIVELRINEKGQITDYSIVHGQDSAALESNIANLVLFSTFTPATSFFRPISGRILVSFLRSRIVVRG